jgi:hypothetical protein
MHMDFAEINFSDRVIFGAGWIGRQEAGQDK